MNKVYLNDILIDDYSNLEQYKLTINGDNNELYLSDFEGSALVYVSIDGNNNRFSLGKNNIIKNHLSINFWNTADRITDGSKIEIGNENFFNGSNIVFISPLDTTIKVGNRNLFAGSITFWGRNDHIIYDINTNKRINKDRNVIIGNENWIGQNVTFLPGGEIADHSVVGYGTIVNKRIVKSNVLLAGIPVKIKKKRINWSRASNEANIDFNNNIHINN